MHLYKEMPGATAGQMVSSDCRFLPPRRNGRPVIPALADADVFGTFGDDAANIVAVADSSKWAELMKARRGERPALTEGASDGREPEKADNNGKNFRAIQGHPPFRVKPTLRGQAGCRINPGIVWSSLFNPDHSQCFH